MEQQRETWGGTIGFVLAAAGSAIGLGNIWKFPYITGMNGGGAFVIIYLVCIFILGTPLMLSEIAIGRKTKKNPYGAFKELSPRGSKFSLVLGALLILQGVILGYSGIDNLIDNGTNSGMLGFGVISAIAGGLIIWKGIAMVGLFSILTGLAILSYYSVIGGWLIEYVYLAFTNQMNFTTVDEAKGAFGNFITCPWKVIMLHLIFMVLCAAMLWGGIRKGVERWSKILMPLLLLLLIAVIIRGVTLPGAINGVKFFLSPDFSKLSTGSVLEALGHSFYSLSLGMGIMITYGSYMKKTENILRTSVFIIILDTAAALMAGLAIFPAVFAMGGQPSAGPSLIFQVLPVTFNHFPGAGWFWAGLFFLMLTIAAFTSGASLLEMGVTFMIDQLKVSRKVAISILFVIISLLGILSAISVTGWENLPWVKSALDFCFGANHVKGNFFDVLDYITSNWCLPLAGMMTAIFAGWLWGARKAARELREGDLTHLQDSNILLMLSGFKDEPFYSQMIRNGLTIMSLWAILIRFVAPIIILFVFLRSLGINMGF